MCLLVSHRQVTQPDTSSERAESTADAEACEQANKPTCYDEQQSMRWPGDDSGVHRDAPPLLPRCAMGIRPLCKYSGGMNG